MQIVFIGPFGLQPKGTMSGRALPMARMLVARGHQVTLLIPPWDDPDRSGQAWTETGVQVVNVDLPQRWPGCWPGIFHILVTRTLVTQALAWQPEVIHLFKPKAYAGLAHLLLWSLRRWQGRPRRLVVDSDDWEQAWNKLLPYSKPQQRFFAWQETWGLRHADAITVASKALEELVVTKIGVKSSQVFYVPNGLNAAASSADHQSAPPAIPPALPITSSHPQVLLFSRFAEFRLERIVTLVRLVAEQMPQARWLMVGRGFGGEEKILAAKLAQAGLRQYARFVTDWIPPAQLPAYFAAVNVAVYPYDNTLLNRTKCSVKLIDMLAAGLPVVADAVGQNCEYIQSGVSGLLVPPEDDGAMARAVLTLLQDSELRQRLGRAAARYIRENFGWSELIQTVEKAYG